jgi:membrane-bound metal-dependent hydrolase YbcI (DUF457 family)
VFIGHFALGLAAKRVTPRLSLAVLFAAAQLADILWPIFVALGLEQVRIDPGNTAFTPLDFVSYPYSHSLALLIVWGVAFGWIVAARSRRETFAVIAALVVSHWVLDYVTHRPDMPLYPGGPKVGLGLWNSRLGTIALEVPMYLAGLWVYYSSTRPRDRAGRYGFGFLAAALLVLYVGNLTGPPPPSVTALWSAAIAGSVIILAAALWADRHRDAI